MSPRSVPVLADSLLLSHLELLSTLDRLGVADDAFLGGILPAVPEKSREFIAQAAERVTAARLDGTSDPGQELLERVMDEYLQPVLDSEAFIALLVPAEPRVVAVGFLNDKIATVVVPDNDGTVLVERVDPSRVLERLIAAVIDAPNWSAALAMVRTRLGQVRLVRISEQTATVTQRGELAIRLARAVTDALAAALP